METAKPETAATPQDKAQEVRGGESRLVQCYGQIGISAVAAAARYQGAAKNPAYAPADVAFDRWLAIAAA